MYSESPSDSISIALYIHISTHRYANFYTYICMHVSCPRHLALAGGRHETPASVMRHFDTVGPAALPCTLLVGDFSTGKSIPVDFVADLFVRRVGACELNWIGSGTGEVEWAGEGGWMCDESW